MSVVTPEILYLPAQTPQWSPPPKVEVKGKVIRVKTSGQTNRITLIVQTSIPQLIETTHPIGFGFIWIHLLMSSIAITLSHASMSWSVQHLFPKIVLCFQLSWGDSIIMPLIKVILSFTLKGVYLKIPLNLFQICTPLQPNQLMIVKWSNYCNSSTQSMMLIFWMLNSRLFRLEQWPLLIQNFIHSLLCCFINTEYKFLYLKLYVTLFYVRPNQGQWEIV